MASHSLINECLPLPLDQEQANYSLQSKSSLYLFFYSPKAKTGFYIFTCKKDNSVRTLALSYLVVPPKLL